MATIGKYWPLTAVLLGKVLFRQEIEIEQIQEGTHCSHFLNVLYLGDERR